MTQDTPPDLRTFLTALRAFARRLLAGAGLVLAFWAFTALSQAHADVLPSPSSNAPHPLPHLKSPARATLRSATHAVSRAPGGLTARMGTGTRRPVSPILHGARKTALGTARTPAALVHGAVPATRTRLGGLSRDLSLPRAVRLSRAARLPAATDATGAVKTRARQVFHPRGRDDDLGCDPSASQRPPVLTPPTVQRPAGVPPIGARMQRARPGPGETGDRPVTSPIRMKLTGTIAPAPRRHDVRPDLRSPLPVPAPVSGAGSGGDSGGKTPSSAGDLPRLHLPAPGLWSLVTEPETTVSRNIADKPPFSPD